MMAVAFSACRNDVDAALEHLRHAVALNPENRSLARQDPDLDALRDRAGRFKRRRSRRPASTAISRRTIGGSRRSRRPELDGTPRTLSGQGSVGVSMSDRPCRRPRRRQRHAHEVRAAQGAAPRRRACRSSITCCARRSRCSPRRPWWSLAIRPTVSGPRLGKRPGLRLCIAGAAARHRPRAAAGGAASSRDARGTLLLLSGDVPLLRRDDAAARWSSAHVATRRGGDGADGASSTDPTGYGRIVREGRRDRGDRRGQGRDAGRARDRRNQQRHLRVRPGAAVRRARGRSGRPTRRGSTTCPTSCGSTARRGLVVETVTLDDPREILGVNSRKELADVAAILRSTQERRADGGRRDDRRSGHGLDRPDVDDRAPTPSSIPTCTSKGRTRIGVGLRDSRRRPHRRLDG